MEDNARLVQCPQCGARAGERCINAPGVLMHRARVELWIQAGKPTSSDELQPPDLHE